MLETITPAESLHFEYAWVVTSIYVESTKIELEATQDKASVIVTL